MENSENPMGTNLLNNLTALKYFYIAMLRLRSTQEAIKKYLKPYYFIKQIFIHLSKLNDIER